MASDERWLTVGQAHEMLAELSISEQTVRDWADSNRLTSRKLPSGHRRIAESSVLAVLREFRGESDD
ncbi:MAG TPA: helix-turn-helix domain-containing protein [Pseudonocardia sp.]